MKHRTKQIVDVVMFILLLYLMSYRAGRGLMLHGLLGCVLFALFFLHNFLNLQWYRGLGKGKYSLTRVVFLILDGLLLADMAGMAISSILMSGDIFAFSPFVTTQSTRTLHVTSTAWGFVLMVLHIGLHTHTFLGKLHQRVKDTIFGYVYILIYLLVLITGITCFVHSGLWRNLLLIPGGRKSHSLLLFYGEYIGILMAGCLLTHILLLNLASERHH